MTNICSRYSNELETAQNKSPSLLKKTKGSKSLLEQTTLINNEDSCDANKISASQLSKSFSNISTASLMSKNGDTSVETVKSKNYVSNLISGLRQRKWIRGRSRTNTNSNLNSTSEKEFNDELPKNLVRFS